jgi:trk system potassium uptake protein TrkH
VIELGEGPETEGRPTVTLHAKLFVFAVLVVFVVGALLLMLPWATEDGTRTGVIDALFTSVSAFSVTGLIVVDTQIHWSFFGEIVILSLIQLGGFGFMVGTSVMLIALGRGTSLRANMMMQDGSPTMSLRDASQLSIKILKFMVVVEVIGAVVLTFHFMRFESLPVSIWWGIFHSVSAFCNAGFDLQSQRGGIIGHNESPTVLVTVATLVQLGAISYMVVADVWRRRAWGPLRLDSKLVLLTNLMLILLSSVLFIAVEWNAAMSEVSWVWRPMNAAFQAMATRTAGFASVDWSQAHDATMYLWIVLMMIGGAAGSTAGGIKLATIAVIIMAVASTVRGQSEPQAFGRRIAPQIVFRSMSIIALFMATHFVLSMCLVLTEDVLNTEDFSFLSLMFEAMSALATVGLSTGLTPDLSSGGKFILVIGMFIGRLGPITVAYALQSKQKQERFRYAEANVRIG